MTCLQYAERQNNPKRSGAEELKESLRNRMVIIIFFSWLWCVKAQFSPECACKQTNTPSSVRSKVVMLLDNVATVFWAHMPVWIFIENIRWFLVSLAEIIRRRRRWPKIRNKALNYSGQLIRLGLCSWSENRQEEIKQHSNILTFHQDLNKQFRKYLHNQPKAWLGPDETIFKWGLFSPLFR